MVEVGVAVPYRRDLERYVGRLIRRLKPRSIILYGSVARGRQGVGSDLDVLVVSDRLPKSFLERLKLLGELNISTAPIEAVAYTPHEFQHMLERTHPTALSAVEDGVELFDDGFFQRQRKRFAMIKKKLKIVRVEGGWERLLKTGQSSSSHT